MGTRCTWPISKTKVDTWIKSSFIPRLGNVWIFVEFPFNSKCFVWLMWRVFTRNFDRKFFSICIMQVTENSVIGMHTLSP